ncbi:hypothetical protein KSK37_13730 [Kaistella sp. DKR-2]|uniref:hypothetical protein n=1 Tax=Kaistella soli TaxID=2849654 RepID=UPI001C278C3E|nr:hypothetical protein [Kaistella soli]MBU8884147.1 hypothetical protein [Kaistella soli]
MTKFYTGVFVLFRLGFSRESKITWQKNLKTSNQDFLSAMTHTVHREMLLGGS